MYRSVLHRIPRARLAAVLLTVGCLAAPVHAATAEQQAGDSGAARSAGPLPGAPAGSGTPTEAEAPSGDGAASKDGTESKDGTPSGTSSEVFIPTEEISEDFAVAFPVDI